MRTVADIMREQRQALAEANSNHRYMTAQSQFALAEQGANLARYYQPTRAGRSLSQAMEARAKNEIDAQMQLAKKMGEPCPTGYSRDGRGECVVKIDQGLAVPTEYQGPTISYNTQSYDFVSAFNRPSTVPGSALVSTLQGLGFDLEIPTCDVLLTRAAALKATVNDPNNCALFSTKMARSMDIKRDAAKLYNEVAAYCQKKSSQVASFVAKRRAQTDASGPSSYNNGTWIDAGKAPALVNRNKFRAPIPKFDPSMPLSGLGYGMGAKAIQNDEKARTRLSVMLDKVEAGIAKLRATYPGVSGPCLPAGFKQRVDLTTSAPSTPSTGTQTPPTNLPPTNLPPVEPPVAVPPTAGEFIKKYAWVILVAGGIGWYAFAKKP